MQACCGQQLPVHHTSPTPDRDWLGGPDPTVQSGYLDRYFPFLGAECAGGQLSAIEVFDPSDACLCQ